MEHHIWEMDTPAGRLRIEEDGSGICGCYFPGNGEKPWKKGEKTFLLAQAETQLREYFNGKRQEFDLPLSVSGTEFQKKVWKALREIPYGETRTYEEIAKAVGNPRACRAVGMANHGNPVAVIIPCHRVIGKNGSLTGYAGGLDVKKILLELEQKGGKERWRNRL